MITAILENIELRKKYFIISQRFYEAFIEHLPEVNNRCGDRCPSG